MYFTDPKYPKLIPAIQKPIAIIKKTIGKLVACKDYESHILDYSCESMQTRLPSADFLQGGEKKQLFVVKHLRRTLVWQG